MQDVAEKMLGEFAKRLEQEILAGPGTAAPATTPAVATPAPAAARPAPERAAAPSEPLDLGNVVSGPLLKRAAPVAGAGLLIAVLAVVLGRKRSRRGLSLTISYR
jgi:hypothetical protein